VLTWALCSDGPRVMTGSLYPYLGCLLEQPRNLLSNIIWKQSCNTICIFILNI
jgi:hypothetical protein